MFSTTCLPVEWGSKPFSIIYLLSPEQVPDNHAVSTATRAVDMSCGSSMSHSRSYNPWWLAFLIIYICIYIYIYIYLCIYIYLLQRSNSPDAILLSYLPGQVRHARGISVMVGSCLSIPFYACTTLMSVFNQSPLVRFLALNPITGSHS